MGIKKVLPTSGKTHRYRDTRRYPENMSDFAGLSVPKLKNLF